MAGKKSGPTIGKTRGFQYGLTKVLGDIGAVIKGPGTLTISNSPACSAVNRVTSP